MLANPLFWIVLVAVAAAMELWSRLVHGRIWHGVLWSAHRSHHTPKTGWFEFNDVFAVFHAGLAIFLIMYGLEMRPGLGYELMAAAGFGMTAFGMSYFLVHDGYIHGRLPVAWLDRFRFMRRVRAAHMVHHRMDSAPYGLFLGPGELRKMVRERRRVKSLAYSR